MLSQGQEEKRTRCRLPNAQCAMQDYPFGIWIEVMKQKLAS